MTDPLQSLLRLTYHEVITSWTGETDQEYV